MCVTAFYFNSNASPGSFKFVLVFNRDECYSRPTQPASFWQDTDIIAGRDLEVGKEGGTWLGVNKNGKVAFLLNIFNVQGPNPQAKGRGSLVSNFLLGDKSPEEYLQEVSKDGDLYNPFKLTCIDLSKNGEDEACFYSNKTTETPCRLEAGFHGCSNSGLKKPWPKASYVKSRLEELVTSYSTAEEDKLIEKLFEVFSNDSRIDGNEFDLPANITLETDAEVFQQVLPQLIMVKTPFYGTRSTTVVAVKDNNEAIFVEKYLEEPIVASNYQWKTKQYRFTMGLEICAL